jgi:hypothetical protein
MIIFTAYNTILHVNNSPSVCVNALNTAFLNMSASGPSTNTSDIAERDETKTPFYCTVAMKNPMVCFIFFHSYNKLPFSSSVRD